MERKFCVFGGLTILNGYLKCAQMERVRNSDSEKHVKKQNRTSSTDLSFKTLWDIFLGHPVLKRSFLVLYILWHVDCYVASLSQVTVISSYLVLFFSSLVARMSHCGKASKSEVLWLPIDWIPTKNFNSEIENVGKHIHLCSLYHHDFEGRCPQ